MNAQERAKNHMKRGLDDMEHYMESCKELSEEKAELQSRLTTTERTIERLQEVLEEIEAVACGETQIESDGSYDDSDGMKWIYDRIQSFKGDTP